MAATTIIVVLGGIAVWLLGKTAIHIGASGLIFGWFGFLLVRGLVEKRVIPLLIAIAIVVLYGGMFWGVLPGQPGVSWEAHLFGFIAGAAAAVLLRSGR
jgi:membrane associated rhomboid family serine protease